MRTTFINAIFCLLLFEAFYLLELGWNDNFLQKLVKKYEENIGSILNSGQSYLVLNVESEIQIIISFFLGLMYADSKCKYKCTSGPHLICKMAIKAKFSSCFS